MQCCGRITSVPATAWQQTWQSNNVSLDSEIAIPLVTDRTRNTLNLSGLEPETIYPILSPFNQLDAQNLFHNEFYFMPLHVSSTCAHHQEVKTVLYSIWYHHTCRWPSRAPDMCSKHEEAWNKLVVKQKFCASSWLITRINIFYTGTIVTFLYFYEECLGFK